MATIELKLLIGHLAAAFLLQPSYATTETRKPAVLVKQAVVKLLAMLFVFMPLESKTAGTIGVLVVCGAIVDVLERRLPYTEWRAFVAAQLAHLGLITAASFTLASGDSGNTGRAILGILSDARVLAYAAVYVGVVAGGDALVQKVAAVFAEQIPDLKDKKPGLRNAGRYIGWLERSLIVSFIVAGYGDAIGFLVATKALARFPKLQGDEKGLFTDYFLVGTLTSVGVALCGGIMLRMAGLTLPEPTK